MVLWQPVWHVHSPVTRQELLSAAPAHRSKEYMDVPKRCNSGVHRRTEKLPGRVLLRCTQEEAPWL